VTQLFTSRAVETLMETAMDEGNNGKPLFMLLTYPNVHNPTR
jgi:hypothetical protein